MLSLLPASDGHCQQAFLVCKVRGSLIEVMVENLCLLSELCFCVAVKILVGKGIWTQKCEFGNLGHLKDCS